MRLVWICFWSLSLVTRFVVPLCSQHSSFRIPILMLSLFTLRSHPFFPHRPRHFPSPAPSITHSTVPFLLRVHEAPCMRAWEPCKGDPSSSFAASSTLPSPSTPFEDALPSSPATRTRWPRHCRRRAWRALPQTARFDRGSPSRACEGPSCWLRPQTQTPGRSCKLQRRR